MKEDLQQMRRATLSNPGALFGVVQGVVMAPLFAAIGAWWFSIALVPLTLISVLILCGTAHLYGEIDALRSISNYTITLYPDQLDGGWIAECDQLPGCVSQGATRGEAMTNIADAIAAVEEIRNLP